MPPRAQRPVSLATELERVRLGQRADRLEAVVRELRRRARNHPAPHLLRHAIAGFDHELTAVRQRLGRRA